MDLRHTFNEDVLNYDKMRPTYAKELYNDIFKFSNMSSGKSVLEIGIGTGQATLPFLESDCDVMAVELGSELAKFCKVKYSGYENFSIMHADFESVSFDDECFDLIYSATAFHWIPEETGYPKTYRLLKDGGTLALFWNHPYLPQDALYFAMQEVYDKYMPSGSKKTTVHRFCENNCLKIVNTIIRYGFINVNYKLYYHTRIFNADDYIALLNTYSDHRALERDKWVLFEKELRNVIYLNGGQVTIHDTMDLYMANKINALYPAYENYNS